MQSFFPPTSEPDNRTRVLENKRSSARSLAFPDDLQGKDVENTLSQNRRANDQSLDNTRLPATNSDHVGNCSLEAADILSQAGLRNPEVGWFSHLFEMYMLSTKIAFFI